MWNIKRQIPEALCKFFSGTPVLWNRYSNAVALLQQWIDGHKTFCKSSLFCSEMADKNDNEGNIFKLCM
jgi:hypothetical protein